MIFVFFIFFSFKTQNSKLLFIICVICGLFFLLKSVPALLNSEGQAKRI